MIMMNIKCPYCKKVFLAEVGNDFLNFDTAEYTVGLKCNKCSKDYKVVFNAEGVYEEKYDGE